MIRDLHHFYSQRKNEFTKKCEKLKSSINRIALGRTFIALVILIVFYFAFSQSIFWYALVILILIFLFLVSRHGKLESQYDLNINLEKLNALELLALKHYYSSFGDGQQYSNPDHAFSYDLDLFGQGSLFQFLNRCGTAIGEDKLAFEMTEAQSSREMILEKQNAIEELAKDVELRQWFWAKGDSFKNDKREKEGLFKWLQEKDQIYGSKIYEVLLVLFPAVSLLLIGLTIYDFWAYLPFLLLFAGVQWTVISFKAKEVTKAEHALSHHRKLLYKYSELLNRIAHTKFSASKLKSMQHEGLIAAQSIKQFSQLVNAFESRKNGIASLFGNSLYLYDLQCLYRLEKWRSKNHSKVNGWFEKIAEIDALISLATFHFNHQENAFPIIGEKLAIHSTEMGHPLIDAGERVNNSFTMGDPENIMLITGANMAGKSTFLRTVGVNLVLALSGSSVCAKEFVFPLVNLKTSMRATDSLVDHQSYFYAELSRLKMIMESVRSLKPTMVLLDEILRGTNSKDKQEGSIGLITQFVSHKALVMVASHDVVLGELKNEFPSAIQNYCFESEIENDALTFDYTLHKGVAQKANATFLMQKMGILPPSE